MACAVSCYFDRSGNHFLNISIHLGCRILWRSCCCCTARSEWPGKEAEPLNTSLWWRANAPAQALGHGRNGCSFGPSHPELNPPKSLRIKSCHSPKYFLKRLWSFWWGGVYWSPNFLGGLLLLKKLLIVPLQFLVISPKKKVCKYMALESCVLSFSTDSPNDPRDPTYFWQADILAQDELHTWTFNWHVVFQTEQWLSCLAVPSP